MALLMASIDATIVATALPTLTRETGSSISWSSWTITAYLLGQTAAMPLAGRLSDSLGRRRMFLVFVATFTLASVLCGLAVNIYWLIAFRFVQALGGGGLMPSAMGTIADRFGRDRDRAIGLLSSVFPLGALLGPALGGVIVTYWSWRGIFFINVPVGVVLLVALAWLLPRSGGSRDGAIDFVGAGFMSTALLALMFGLNQFGERGLDSPIPWVSVALGAILLAAFGVRQQRTAHPIFAPALLRSGAFAIVNGLNLFYGAAAIGVASFVPLFAQAAYGLGPLPAGTLLTARALGMVVVAFLATLAIRRTGYRVPIFAGFVLMALGLVLMAQPPARLSPYWWLALAALVSGMGVGLAGPGSNNAAIELLPGQVAAISGLRGMFRQFGAIVAVSMVAMLLAHQADQAQILRRIFEGMALISIAVTPAVIGVPERRADRYNSSM
jgi:EmrB/QacA subfamily drug resistance transporter